MAGAVSGSKIDDGILAELLLKGLKYREAADYFGVTTGAVRNRALKLAAKNPHLPLPTRKDQKRFEIATTDRVSDIVSKHLTDLSYIQRKLNDMKWENTLEHLGKRLDLIFKSTSTLEKLHKVVVHENEKKEGDNTLVIAPITHIVDDPNTGRNVDQTTRLSGNKLSLDSRILQKELAPKKGQEKPKNGQDDPIDVDPVDPPPGGPVEDSSE